MVESTDGDLQEVAQDIADEVLLCLEPDLIGDEARLEDIYDDPPRATLIASRKRLAARRSGHVGHPPARLGCDHRRREHRGRVLEIEEAAVARRVAVQVTLGEVMVGAVNGARHLGEAPFGRVDVRLAARVFPLPRATGPWR